MIEEDVAPLVEELHQAADAVAKKVVAPYRATNEETIVSSMTLEDQARLSLASAYSALSALYCYKRLKNLPVDGTVTAKLDRVKDYIRKVKRTDLASMETTRKEAKQSRKTERGGDGSSSVDALDLALGEKRPRVNQDASIRMALEAAKPE